MGTWPRERNEGGEGKGGRKKKKYETNDITFVRLKREIRNIIKRGEGEGGWEWEGTSSSSGCKNKEEKKREIG